MISNVKATEGVGENVLKKVIHEGSESIMFSVLQETQYMYPFKSSVREIVSNSLDSVNEKNNAIKILDGEISTDDLFIEKEGTEFADSRFNAEYYDRKWLSDNNVVTIRYIDNDTKTRDRIQFIDEGVGLGGDRLIKYFSLGFSTKRLSKNQLGSFGLGAKSLLATGVDMYTVTSCYNGREYSFNVYKDHVVPAIDKFNEDGTVNKEETFYNDFKCFYRDTKSKNKVTIEAEVKRHRKDDYISGIENQLGYIDNVEFVIYDKNYPSYGDAKRTIKSTVLYSTDDVVVGDRSYYAVPQILLKPGDDSPIRINYGPINFDELEMKKYSGNVGFVMNINKVDVTPSRESVIWNTKTRDAIKDMFLTAQKTITDSLTKKLDNVSSLVDHTYMLSALKSRSSSDSMSELYKVVDLSDIDVNYNNFRLADAAIQLSNFNNKGSLIFTSTKSVGNYWSSRLEDTNYSSALTKKYLANMSTQSDETVMVYIGDAKSKGIARYFKHKILGDNHSDSVDVIYIKPKIYDEYVAKIQAQGGIESFLEHSYETRDFYAVLVAETIRLATTMPHLVIKEGDIDKTKMSNLAKEEEEKANTSQRYMTEAQRAKLAGKVIGNRHYNGKNTTREYYDESKAAMDSIIIYQMNDPGIERIFSHVGYGDLSETVVGFSEANFKRFYKVQGVRLLINCLYTIEFGDLKFTKLGKELLPYNVKNQLKRAYSDREDFNNIELPNGLKFLRGQFANLFQDKNALDDEVRDRINKIDQHKMDYLLEDRDDLECKYWRCPSNEK